MTVDRRTFLGAAAAGVLAPAALAHARGASIAPGDDHRGAAVIASGNGVNAVRRAYERMHDGADPAVAVVEGVGLVERDPNDLTVGLGGLPNEDGVVQLDASVMHGPLHKAGAVAALEDTVHAAAVALKVLQTTDHVMLVGEGATRFARANGFPEENLLTERTRKIWLRWKRNLSPTDDWLDDSQLDWERDENDEIVRTTGTIHCSAVTPGGALAGTTTTSGLSYKIPGRVGDSPIIGAGLYTDNEVGSAGATGRGEAVIQSCGSFSIVRHMAAGKSPTEACLAVLKEIADRSVKQRRLRDAAGRPNFNVVVYAVRKDGAYGSAAMFPGAQFAVATDAGARKEPAASLYPDR